MSVRSPGEASFLTEIDPSGYGLRRARAWQTIAAPSRGPGPIGRPASSHACPASRDTPARGSAKHHARAIMPQARQSFAGNQSKDQCMQRIWQSKHCATRGRACARQPAAPYGICSQMGESAGRSARCQGPNLVLAKVGHVGRVRRRRSVGARRWPRVPHIMSSPGFAPLQRRVRNAATVGRAPLNRGQRPFLSAAMQGSAGL